MKSSVDIACEILDELHDRSGFDGWWDSLDDQLRDEILTRMSSIINADWPQGPQAPIAQLTINQAGEIAGTLMYAPGLPPGDHDLYCEPETVARYLRGNSRVEQPAARQAHNLKVGGANPPPASIHLPLCRVNDLTYPGKCDCGADQPSGES